MSRALAILVVAALVALPSVAIAAECAPRTTVADLEDEVMCPVCGTSLGLAREAPQAKRERALIARLIDSCRSKAEIKAALVAEFGPAVLAEPDRRGFSASAYIVPLAVGGAALAAVLLSLFRWRRRNASPPSTSPPHALSAEDASRLAVELDRPR